MVLAACGEKPSDKAAATAPTTPLVVGISLPLTGDFSQPGGEAKRGYEVWQSMVNAKGGVLGRQVELKITDDASNQDTVVA
ncbi:MAG: ABC transporter substrate-binding protein, partial [Actinobacteria bacterium]|nr:ABC transporter substrate-binding protein [Actinomycetota bacterium]